jgi:nitrate reductase cytochrome c-type subunit
MEGQMAPMHASRLVLSAGVAFAAGLSAALAQDAPAGLQPPPRPVPHAIAGYKIGRDVNECLPCHQPPANEKAGARKMTDDHYVYRQGVRLDKILATRVYCNQCHAPKADAKPLPAGGRP